MEQTHLQNDTNLQLEGINQSGSEKHYLIKQFSYNRNIDEPFYSLLIALYSFLIVFGSTGNILVVMSVIRNKQMQTARNIFIVNLAISDLLLCLVTMPLTLIEILSKYWPLGDSNLLCKMIGTLQGTSIFVSTISILAIALDRYQVIVGCPAKDNLQMLGAFLILTLIWSIAILFSAPLFIYRSLKIYNINITSLDFKHKILYCEETWPELPFFDGRVYYSIFSIFIQYFIPILVVSSAYMKIYFRLKKRFVIAQNVPAVDERIQNRLNNRGRRMKRTNCLLISIALIFGVSWLPLNFFNLYADLNETKMTHTVYIIYAACHLFGMSSACSNPLLYGWLNDNFRKEFNEILCCLRNHDSSSSALKLRAMDVSFVAQKKALSEVCDIDKQSKLLLMPNSNRNCSEEMQDLKSEFTLTSNI